jgi:hypothetical protein
LQKQQGHFHPWTLSLRRTELAIGQYTVKVKEHTKQNKINSLNTETNQQESGESKTLNYSSKAPKE